MQFEGASLLELIEFDSDGGSIRFAGQRALLIDATALGTLRKDLIGQFGLSVARVLLTRLGFIQGWRLAEAVQQQPRWEQDSHKLVGDRLHMLAGMYRILPGSPGSLSVEGLTLTESFEAEQHIAHLGRGETGVCWMICGLTSGYLSRSLGKEIYVLEERCIGKGDPACHLLARTREGWGDERAGELRFFHREQLTGWLDGSLHQVTETLKKVEKRLREREHALALVVGELQEPLGMVTRSLAMRQLVDLARRIASVDSTVLITGASGTGKERIARFVHEQSTRSQGPFVAINCGAITESLLESELFGHARGAFTGAASDRPGLFEAANGGTLLLDEVGEIPLGMQVKLLRALQEREVRRVGENRSRPIDARIIAATNSELGAMMDSGRFRKDLYYRLNVVELHVPSLKDRREDILPLARILLAEAAIRLNRPVPELSSRTADQLLRYDWPGNVRELENAMERAVALARVSHTELDDLPEEVRQAVPLPSLTGAVKELEDVEKDYILAVLDLNAGNQTQAAKQLGIGTATLYRKLKKYGRVNARSPDPAEGP